jgi:hypothetical protein
VADHELGLTTSSICAHASENVMMSEQIEEFHGIPYSSLCDQREWHMRGNVPGLQATLVEELTVSTLGEIGHRFCDPTRSSFRCSLLSSKVRSYEDGDDVAGEL